MTKDEMLIEMQLEVEQHLSAIEKIFQRWGLRFDRLTLIVRALMNDNMVRPLTTEDYAGLEKACSLAIRQQASNRAGLRTDVDTLALSSEIVSVADYAEGMRP